MGHTVYGICLLAAVTCGLNFLLSHSINVKEAHRHCTGANLGFIRKIATDKLYRSHNALIGLDSHRFAIYSDCNEINICPSISEQEGNIECDQRSDKDCSKPSSDVRFTAGIEAHIQLAIPHKIFCPCKSTASCLQHTDDDNNCESNTSGNITGFASSEVPRCVELYNRLGEVLSSTVGHGGESRESIIDKDQEKLSISFAEYISVYNNIVWRKQHDTDQAGERPPNGEILEPIHRRNEYICPICRGEVGALPILSPLALLYGLAACHIFSCETARTVTFDRKVYSYDDLPKRYQITQVKNPIGRNGHIVLPSGRRIRIQRLNLEEDSARALNSDTNRSLDYNRSGIGLIEIVTEATECTLQELVDCCHAIYALAVNGGLCKGLMHEGNVRFDINVSGGPIGNKRVEIKNLNSFRRIRRAVTDLLSSSVTGIEDVSNGGNHAYEKEENKNDWNKFIDDVFGTDSGNRNISPVGSTLSWKGSKERTTYMRSKCDGSNYMNFMDPNIPCITISNELLAAVGSSIQSGPTNTNEVNLSATYQDVPEGLLSVIQKTIERTALFRHLAKNVGSPLLVAKWVVNYIIPAVDISSVDVDQLSQLLVAVQAKQINVDTAKRILPDFINSRMQLKEYMRKHDINLLGEAETRRLIDEYITRNNLKETKNAITKPELTSLIRDIMQTAGGRLSYSLVHDYLLSELN